MHCHGWRSIYCIPSRPAFKGSAPLNLSDRLHQVLRWALGSVEIFLSRHCPLWYGYGGGLKWLERLSYINSVVYPLTSIPLLAYCTLPAVCLLTGKFITPDVWSSYIIIFFYYMLFLICFLPMLKLFLSPCSLAMSPACGLCLFSFASLQQVFWKWDGVALSLMTGGEMSSFGLLEVFLLISLQYFRGSWRSLQVSIPTSRLHPRVVMMKSFRSFTHLSGLHCSSPLPHYL